MPYNDIIPRSGFQSIVLKGHGHYEEAPALSDYGYIGDPYIYPGMAVQLTADGAAGVVRIAVEDNLLGKTITDPYAEGGTVRYYIPQPGDELMVLCSIGANLVVGDTLICDTSTGEWIETTGTPQMIPFEVQESSGGALAAAALIRVKRI